MLHVSAYALQFVTAEVLLLSWECRVAVMPAAVTTMNSS